MALNKDCCHNKKEMNTFLIKTFGVGIAEIDLTLYFVYAIYFHSKSYKVQQGCEKRINQINKIKAKVIDLIDFFLAKSDFYQTSKKSTKAREIIRVSVWTPENKKNFIINQYKLGEFFRILDAQIDNYTRLMASLEISSTIRGVEEIIHIKPINFLLLIWSLLIKKRGKVAWKSIESLLVWLSKNFKDNVLYEFYELSTVDRRYAEIMRLTRNKYKNSKYSRMAREIYDMFGNKRIYKETDYPKIIRGLKEYYQTEKQFRVESWQKFNDFLVCLMTLFPEHFS